MELEHHVPFGPFCLSGAHGRLWRGDQVIGLRPRSLAVLRYLVEHPGRLVTKAELRRQVWAGTHVTDSVLRASIKEIRAALGDAATAPRYVETVGQQGYCFRGGGRRAAPIGAVPRLSQFLPAACELACASGCACTDQRDGLRQAVAAVDAGHGGGAHRPCLDAA
jgi:DNA-binding winged helix-turn-helix (wHTH) protein